MKNLSIKRRVQVELLTIKAAGIFNSIYGENFPINQWKDFLKNIYKTAKKSKKEDWLYNCEEMVLNITR